MSYSYNKLRGRIIERYGTQEKFARAINISNNALSKKMTGKTGISQEDIIKWSKLLDIDVPSIGEYFFT